ncbi:LPS translocon maturation chaperone LptM [Idiomarina aquatica]|jgi:predicted small lipoprotein YifL|uniref:LPS translocon maturation chaperone LptM n=1 Tax=Idiomarina TaxID=135575 RepID=UPI001C9E66AF|nr:lipoprotein [Idiomarina aquatica]|tara:strand:+ start:156 stop:329 length:174 start_codon:yes stop_codon:yes gene_type:complete
MIKQIIIKATRTILPLMMAIVVVGCGQKGPLQPQPLPEQNEPAQGEPETKVDSLEAQ